MAEIEVQEVEIEAIPIQIKEEAVYCSDDVNAGKTPAAAAAAAKRER